MEDSVREMEEVVFGDKKKEEGIGREEKERDVANNDIDEEEDPHSSGGAMSNFISDLVHKDSEEDGSFGEEKEGGLIKDDRISTSSGEEKGDRVFNSLISAILNQGGGGGDDGEREEINERVQTEASQGGGGGGGGGLIDNIVSHLPTPLAGDAAPATDEASILIHSIVHD